MNEGVEYWNGSVGGDQIGLVDADLARAAFTSPVEIDKREIAQLPQRLKQMDQPAHSILPQDCELLASSSTAEVHEMNHAHALSGLL